LSLRQTALKVARKSSRAQPVRHLRLNLNSAPAIWTGGEQRGAGLEKPDLEASGTQSGFGSEGNTDYGSALPCEGKAKDLNSREYADLEARTRGMVVWTCNLIQNCIQS
jgi:hypothetical protein